MRGWKASGAGVWSGARHDPAVIATAIGSVMEETMAGIVGVEACGTRRHWARGLWDLANGGLPVARSNPPPSVPRLQSSLRKGAKLGPAILETSTIDKASTTAREHIAGVADPIGAVRVPESAMHAAAGTEAVVDILVFQRRA